MCNVPPSLVKLIHNLVISNGRDGRHLNAMHTNSDSHTKTYRLASTSLQTPLVRSQAVPRFRHASESRYASQIDAETCQ